MTEPPEESVSATAPEDPASAMPDADTLFEALWKRTVEEWDDDKRHAAVLEFALKNEKLPELSGRYRKLTTDPEKGARAQQRIDKIIGAAMSMLTATKTPPRTKIPWQWTAAAALSFVLVCAFLFSQLFLRHR